MQSLKSKFLHNWLYNEWLMWRFGQEINPHSITYLFWCFKSWWKMRPRTTQCQACGQPLWSVGEEDYDYCSKECSDFGPLGYYEDDEEIPF